MEHTKLLEEIDVQNGLLDLLYSEHVLDHNEVDTIKKGHITDVDKNYELLMMLRKKSFIDFELFLYVLNEIGQSHVANRLREHLIGRNIIYKHWWHVITLATICIDLFALQLRLWPYFDCAELCEKIAGNKRPCTTYRYDTFPFCCEIVADVSRAESTELTKLRDEIIDLKKKLDDAAKREAEQKEKAEKREAEEKNKDKQASQQLLEAREREKRVSEELAAMRCRLNEFVAAREQDTLLMEETKKKFDEDRKKLIADAAEEAALREQYHKSEIEDAVLQERSRIQEETDKKRTSSSSDLTRTGEARERKPLLLLCRKPIARFSSLVSSSKFNFTVFIIFNYLKLVIQ